MITQPVTDSSVLAARRNRTAPREPLLHLAVAAIFVGIVAVELLVVGATIPAMLNDVGTPVHTVG